MERFLKRHESRIAGSIAGFDRVLFRGTLLSICHVGGMDRFLSSQRVLYKNFGAFAQKLSDAIKTQAQQMAAKYGRPHLYLESSKQSKEKIARAIMERDRIRQGLICVLSCVEPCHSFDIRRDRDSKWLRLVLKQRTCLHLYFYYLDREFGFMHIRLQTWLPLTIQVCINGREYLARQMDRAGISYDRHENCFTSIGDIEKAQRLLDRLVERQWRSVLDGFASRVNPWLNPKAQPNLRSYYWTIRQGEVATDVMFQDESRLKEVYPALVHHAIEQFSSRDVLRFLGRRTNARFSGEVQTNLVRRVEGVRVKHWVEENSIKMYDKGSVLRIETTINNPKRLRVHREVTRKGKAIKGFFSLRKGIADIRRRVAISKAANARYLDALSVIGEPKPSHRLLDPVSIRTQYRGRNYRALRPISPEDSELFRLISAGECHLQGIRNQDLRTHLYPNAETDHEHLRKVAARVTRKLALLRAHGLIHKVTGTNYYRISKNGHDIISTAIKFRETDMALLAA